MLAALPFPPKSQELPLRAPNNRMAIVEQWNIKTRAHACAQTGVPFREGEMICTALFEDPKTGELIRADCSEAGWEELCRTKRPFSSWRSKYESNPAASRPEMLEKSTADGLLRRLIEEDSPATESTRYILAVMLERKKQLRPAGTKETEEDTYLVYEHVATGEVYIVRDPELQLDQLQAVQQEVSRMLPGGGAGAAPAPSA